MVETGERVWFRQREGWIELESVVSVCVPSDVSSSLLPLELTCQNWAGRTAGRIGAGASLGTVVGAVRGTGEKD